MVYAWRSRTPRSNRTLQIGNQHSYKDLLGRPNWTCTCLQGSCSPLGRTPLWKWQTNQLKVEQMCSYRRRLIEHRSKTALFGSQSNIPRKKQDHVHRTCSDRNGTCKTCQKQSRIISFKWLISPYWRGNPHIRIHARIWPPRNRRSIREDGTCSSRKRRLSRCFCWFKASIQRFL